MTKKTLPIFIPHLGCPHDCLFCDQHTITAVHAPTPSAVSAQIASYLATCPQDREIELAFFGGSFTALPTTEIEAYLSAAKPFLECGAIRTIRCSTRPDAIDAAVLELLKQYGVTTVEIGIQSMSDTVLKAAHRGHSAADSIAAAKAIRAAGLSLVGQMMLGLPYSTLADECATADAIHAMGASAVRIYPTVIFPHTGLAALRAQGLYTPPSMEEMTARGAAVLARFVSAGVSVLRIGLCANEYLQVADACTGFHPAIGELIRARYYRDLLERQLSAQAFVPSAVTVLVPRGAASQVAGQHAATRAYFQDKFGTTLTILESALVPAYQIQIQTETKGVAVCDSNP